MEHRLACRTSVSFASLNPTYPAFFDSAPKKETAVTNPILDIADVELQARPPAFAPTGTAAQRYDARMGAIGQRLGAQKLGGAPSSQ